MTLSEQCMSFRVKHLAPSGGWLASLLIPLASATGLYDYTLLAFVFIFVVKIMLSSSCEAALIAGFAFDFVIPCQYHNAGLHQAELDAYWPKMIMATSIEVGCYVLFDPDLFNVIALVKTLVMFSIWMKDEKQWPLVFPDGRDKQSRDPSSRSQRSKNDAGRQNNGERSTGNSDRQKAGNPLVTKEYLQYVADNFKDLSGHADSRKKDEFKRLMQDLVRKPDHDRYKHAMGKLKQRNVLTPEEYAQKNAGGSGSTNAAPQGSAGQAGASPSPPAGSQPSAGSPAGSSSTAPQSQTPASSTAPANPQNGQTPPSGGRDAKSYKGKSLKKAEVERLDKLIKDLKNPSTGKPMPAEWQKAAHEALSKNIDDPDFQALARTLNGIEGTNANLPMIEWPVPSDAEIESVIEACKRPAAGETEEQHAQAVAEVDKIAQVLREAFKKGPYEAGNWKAVQDFCRHARRIACPEWLDPPPEFIEGCWIPWETQTEIIKRIVASNTPHDKVRGLCDAVEYYYSREADFVATINEINETAKLDLKPNEIVEKSSYLPYKLRCHDAPQSMILISASHWKEAKDALRANANGTGDEEPYRAISEFDAVVEQFPTLRDPGTADAYTKVIFKWVNVDHYGRRTEHYTDYYPGRLQLPVDYLKSLRDRWQKTRHGDLPLDLVDTILYAVKMSDSRAAADELVKKFDEAITQPGDAWYQFYKQYEKLSYVEREGNHLFEKCKELGDTFLGDGGGISTYRVNGFSDKYP